MNTSIRNHPQLKQMFIAAESRHLDSAEFELYHATLPKQVHRVKAAQEIKLIQAEVVNTTIKEVFNIYPFLDNHELADGKCYRDVNYVAAYVTLAMLMDDPEWLRNKFLIWFKTILQAFCFPQRNKEVSIPTHRLVTIEADKLPSMRSSIYETYSRLKRHFHQKLSPETYSLIEPLLQMACDILAAE